MSSRAAYKEICKEMVREVARKGGSLLLEVEIFHNQRDYILRDRSIHLEVLKF